MKTQSPHSPPESFWRSLADRTIRSLRADPTVWINTVLGILGWGYVFVLYWNGQGLGSKLPAYAAF